MIVVLDTNIWVSALQFGGNHGSPAQALERIERQDSIAIADELEFEVVHTLVDKFAWSPRKTREAIDVVLRKSRRFTLSHTVRLCRDLRDNMFLELAGLASADLLVTGDKDLLVLRSYAGTRIVTPLEYINLP